MSALYNTQPSAPSQEDTVYYEETISPVNAMFLPEMSGPYVDNPHLLHIPQNVTNHRQSISPSTDVQSMSFQQSYPSRPPSLSPSSQSMFPLQPAQQSPHSSASPSSNYSISATDDFLLANSFSSNELDMLLFQNSDYQVQPGKQGHSLFLPQNRAMHSSDGNGTIYYPPNSAGGQTNLSRDDTFDMLNLVDASPAGNQRRFSVVSTESYLMPKMEYTNTANMASVQPSTYQPQQSFQPPWMGQQVQQAPYTPMPQGWQPTDTKPVPQATMYTMPRHGESTQSFGPDDLDAYPSNRQTFDPVPIVVPPTAKLQPIPQTRVIAGRRGPLAVNPESVSPPEVPAVGKHNKTERRYRQKVQAAQADLRDSVPALRVLYGTSSEAQRRRTDFRAADGTVDGLGEITRPNASAKTTIFLGARLYIELLQRRVGSLQRKVDELEVFRMAVAGEDDLRRWQAEFEQQERERQAQADIASQLRAEEDSFDEEDEDEDEEPKRKKPRAVPKSRGKSGPKGKEDPNFGPGGPGGGVRVFAAFAMSFSLFPSASTLFRHSPGPEMASGIVFSNSSTTGQVLSRLPLITAEHTSRLLSRGLPHRAVPHPHTLVDWGWRLLVAVVLAVLLWPLAQRWTRSADDDEVPAGSISGVTKDSIKLAASKWAKAESESDCAAWNSLAAGMLGGGESCITTRHKLIVTALNPTTLARWHVILRLNRTAKDAYSLALLALLQPEVPFLRTPQALWQAARAKLQSDSSASLRAVLALPFDEAINSLDLLPKTAAPIAAIAEQITLVHINDLYSRLFIRLVDASAKNGASSVKTLLDNLEKRDLGKSLKSSAYDKEIRGVVEGVPRGSASHALGLVLIGIWGVFTGPDPSAQAALASALAAEEVKGAGSALSSVSAMLELLYPGSSSAVTIDRISLISTLPANALAIDRLALVCVEYVRLLSSAFMINAPLSRLQRLEASQKVQTATSHLRLMLTQTTFVGLAEDDEEDFADGEARSFEEAKERLVGVLSVVGRRAAGRASGRDEDSGLEGDLDEL